MSECSAWILLLLVATSCMINCAEGGSEVPDEKESPLRRQKRMVKWDQTWTKGIVPYHFTDVIDSEQQDHIKNAMLAYERFTCFRFMPWSKKGGKTTNQIKELGHPSFLKFIVDGCWATQGMASDPNGQSISCCGSYTCLHELGHSLGAYHEHQNPKSEGFVRVNPNAVAENMGFTFMIRSEQFSLGYDIQSIMHYKHHEFARGTNDSISYLFSDLTPTGHDSFYLMGELSSTHNCHSKPFCINFDMRCYNDGYKTFVEGKCACRCPIYLDPDTGCTTLRKLTSSHYPKSWPKGSYGLPKTDGGCLEGFKLGYRAHNAPHDPRCPSDVSPTTSCIAWKQAGNCDNAYKGWMATNCGSTCHGQCQYDSGKPANSHINDGVSQSTKETTVTHMFCVKEEVVNFKGEEEEKWNWPHGAGAFCIYRKGGKCPKGFQTGNATFKGIDTESNGAGGTLPDGVYKDTTTLEFCCRTEMDLNTEPLKFPTSKPFALMKLAGRHVDCPKVEGMHSKVEKTRFKNTGLVYTKGQIPVETVDDDSNLYAIVHCYYEPVKQSCGGVIELSETNPTFEFSSPKDNSNTLCIWFIKGPEKTRLLLKFPETSFKRENGGKCIDHLDISFFRLGSSPQRTCNDGYTRTYSTIYNTLVVTYESFDQTSEQNSSFKAEVSLMNNNNHCYKMDDHGRTYAGKTDYTRTFKPCLPWAETAGCPYHPFRPSNTMAYLNKNYCRNPGAGLRPWCYTDLKQCSREYCDVCHVEHDSNTNCTAICKSEEQCVRACKKHISEPKQPAAKTIKCGKPPVLPDGTLVDAVKDEYNVGDGIRYKCKLEFNNQTMKSPYRKCLTTGKWSSLNYACSGCITGAFLLDGHCLKYEQNPRKYLEAVDYCNLLGAKLATVKTQLDNSELLKMRSNTGEVWLGGSDAKKEGDWIWVDGTKLESSWVNWGKDQPDNGNLVEDYLSQGSDGLWYDSWKHYPKAFFCEHAPFKTKVCDDFANICQELHAEDPRVCPNHVAYMESNCKKTCGLC